MSTDAIGVAFGCDDATVAARTPQITAGSSNELTGIAMAIERVEALLVAYGLVPGGADAIERIADIAFVLHERDVEASLCDALDAAIRELNNANVVKQANVQHVRQAAELLRELSLRVADMIALLQVSPAAAADQAAASDAAPQEGEPPLAEPQASEDVSDGEILDGEIPREGLFTAELLEDDEFARAVAELAASLPALAEPVEAVVVALREPADLATGEPALAPEPQAAVAETQHEPADLVAEEPALASEPEESVADAQCEPAGLTAKESAPAMDNARAVIEQTPAEEPATTEIANEQLSCGALAASDVLREEPKDDAISNASLRREGALNETLSGEALLESADLPGISPNYSLTAVHGVVSPPDADAASAPAETPSTPAPQEMPESEIALAPDESLAAVPEAELDLAPGDAPSPLADAAGSAAERLSDQIMAGQNGGGPIQTADVSYAHDTSDAIIEAATDVTEELAPPPRVSESSQSLLPELALVDPQDDPGDLFEPLADAAPPIAAAKLAPPQGANEISAPAATMRTHFAAAATDPLAAMRALSAEELLALFT